MPAKSLLLLPGDGVGPEIFDAMAPVFDWLSRRIDIRINRALAGHCAYLAEGATLSDATLAQALASDAVLFGAEDTEAYIGLPPGSRPPSALLRLRLEMGVFANLRPIRVSPNRLAESPLRPEIVSGTDCIIVRELVSGLYFGKPRGIETLPDGRRRGVDSLVYFSDEIERVARVAFELARSRSGRLCSVDKANVLATGALWREVVTTLGKRDYPDVALSHMYVDNCAMQLVARPTQFDVIVTENTFGDILSDCAAVIPGSIGMLASASLSGSEAGSSRRGLYEPIHGSAPDIAGKDIANPGGTLLSLAMALDHSLDAPELARELEGAIEATLDAGVHTRDLGANHCVGTRAFARAVRERLPNAA